MGIQMEPEPDKTNVSAQPEAKNQDKDDESMEQAHSHSEHSKKEPIVRVGKKLNENGEWEEYIEEDDPDRPPIVYTYMGQEGLEIESDDEVVDFCMQYRIPK